MPCFEGAMAATVTWRSDPPCLQDEVETAAAYAKDTYRHLDVLRTLNKKSVSKSNNLAS